jgi:hypothetical protein
MYDIESLNFFQSNSVFEQQFQLSESQAGGAWRRGDQEDKGF